MLKIYEDILPGEIPKRSLGKTGERLSILGFGGIALQNNGQELADKLIPMAFNAGINYFDIAPGYGDAQKLMGPPLKKFRKKIFLACKTNRRDRKGSEEDLHESLRLLKTDHFDLYQFHELASLKEVESVFGPDGAMKTFIKARKEGKIRHIGFSAHNEEVALRMMDLFDFDTILYPINCVCWHNGNFGPAVYETAKQKGMGILALKAVAKTSYGRMEDQLYPNMWYKPFEEDEEIEKALQFTLSKDVTAMVHAGDSYFMKKTLDFVTRGNIISAPDDTLIKQMIKGIAPIFSNPTL